MTPTAATTSPPPRQTSSVEQVNPIEPNATLSPTPRQWWRKSSAWIYIGIGLVVLTLVMVLIRGAQVSSADGIPLSPDSPRPSGTKALVSVLQDHGVSVQQTDSLDDTENAVSPQTTLVVSDTSTLLDSDDWERIRQLNVDHLIVLAPNYTGRQWVKDVAQVAGAQESDPEQSLPAGSDCGDLGSRAPRISTTSGSEYSPTGDAHGCYRGENGYALVTGSGDGAATKVTVIGQPLALTNGNIASHANAAMAINVLGENPHLVWYVPSLKDLPEQTARSAYVPQWQLPAIILLIIAGITACVAYGRRFGPLVAERLPVAVPANETIEGRARLYGQAGAHIHALDAIRIGTLDRIADLAGIGRNTSAEAVADACAALAHVPRDHAHAVLITRIPENAGEMVDLANACAELERRVRAAVGRESKHRGNTASETPTTFAPLRERRNPDDRFNS
ncbi:DUF4350 domain-containing protein [Gulosibacter hominis]|uniref:DUF4350 domain-containing protein n=1 Tax=Gulosibacter hominis TaxID=2770504 RepID=UPI001919346B|nr:DUF4350 domain-containing protein [Gulosibacter hominis]